MLYQSHEHFYLDGDLIISVGGTAFRVHKVIMGLSSQVFQELISRSTTAINGITAIVLDENNSENFKILLSFIYPIGHISISWDNIYELLRLSEKYKMKSPFEASKEFLEKEFFQDPLISLYLAEVYQLDQLYVESSKLILDELNDFRITHNFKLISLNTREKLLDRYMDYIFSLNLLSKDIFISNYKHTCSNPQIHQIELIKSIEELIKKVQIYPTLKPSITKKILCPKFNNYYYNNNNDIGMNSMNSMNCDNIFWEFHVEEKFLDLFGNFENLAKINNNNNSNNNSNSNNNNSTDSYIFIELRDNNMYI